MIKFYFNIDKQGLENEDFLPRLNSMIVAYSALLAIIIRKLRR